MAGTAGSNLPPGFRFHPTDEELIVHYLKNQAMSRPCPVSIIPEVDIYKFDPWQLPAKGGVSEKEWYFFSPRDRKYPNGVRPNRATVSGYWKATGTDKAIYSGTKCVGIKKALVFYQGRPPKGNKMDWIMHEYRLNEPRAQPVKRHGSMRLDDWVLCRIYKKKHAGRIPDQKLFEENSQRQVPPATGTNQLVGITTNQDSVQHQVLKFPRTVSFAQLLDMDYLGPVSHMLNENSSFSSAFEFQGSLDRSRNGLTTTGERSRLGEAPYVQYSDLTTMSTMNQPNGVLLYDSPLSKLA